MSQKRTKNTHTHTHTFRCVRESETILYIYDFVYNGFSMDLIHKHSHLRAYAHIHTHIYTVWHQPTRGMCACVCGVWWCMWQSEHGKVNTLNIRVDDRKRTHTLRYIYIIHARIHANGVRTCYVWTNEPRNERRRRNFSAARSLLWCSMHCMLVVKWPMTRSTIKSNAFHWNGHLMMIVAIYTNQSHFHRFSSTWKYQRIKDSFLFNFRFILCSIFQTYVYTYVIVCGYTILCTVYIFAIHIDTKYLLYCMVFDHIYRRITRALLYSHQYDRTHSLCVRLGLCVHVHVRPCVWVECVLLA